MSTRFLPLVSCLSSIAAVVALAACSGTQQSNSIPASPSGFSADSSTSITPTQQGSTLQDTSIAIASTTTASSTTLPYASTVIADHPSAFIKLNDSSSSVGVTVGSGLRGTYGSHVGHERLSLTKDGTGSAGFSGGAYSTASVVNLFPSSALTPASVISTDMWIQLGTANTSGNVEPIVAYGSHATNVPYEIQLTPRNTLKWLIYGGAPYYTWGAEETEVLQVGKSYHIAATYDGYTQRMYVNGVQTLSSAARGPLTYKYGYDGLTVGGESGNTLPMFHGYVSDIAIYPSTLSSAQIERHYTAGAGATSTGGSVSPTPSPTSTPSAISTPIPTSTYETPKSVFSFEDSIGLNTHFNYTNSPYYTHQSQDTALIRALPVHHIRDGSLDELPLLNTLCAGGVHHSVLFPINITAAQITAQLDQFGTTCVDYVEPMNEYDSQHAVDPNWAAHIFAETKLIYTTVRANSKYAHITVLGPGLSSTSNYKQLPGISQYSDAASIHDSQCDGSPMTTHYKNVAQALSEITSVYSKPVWTTEVAVFNNPGLTSCGITTQVAAKYIPRQLLVRFNLGMPHNYYNELSEFPAIAVWGTLGIIDPNSNPYPAYTALHSLFATLPTNQSSSTTLSRLNYALAGSTANLDHTLLEGNDGTYYMILWSEVDSWDVVRKVAISPPAQAVALKLPSVVRSATVSYPQSNYTMSAKTVEAIGGAIPLTVTDSPLVVTFKL